MQFQLCINANNLVKELILTGHFLKHPTGTPDFRLLQVNEAVFAVEKFLAV